MTGTVVIRAGSAPATDKAIAPGASTDALPTTLAILGLATLLGAIFGERRFRASRR